MTSTVASKGIQPERNLIGITISLYPSLIEATFALMKILVAIAFILIIASLGSALVFMMRDKGKSNRTVKALAFRVGFSIMLFVLILIAYGLGWIQPTGIR
jgi:hypothetical protein